MKAVIVVAPGGAHWADRAAIALASEGLHVARLPNACAVGFMMVAGGVAAVLFDHRSLRQSWPELRARLQVIAPAARLLVIREDGEDDVAGTVSWPHDLAAVMRIVGGQR
jgi:hypothetical protein